MGRAGIRAGAARVVNSERYCLTVITECAALAGPGKKFPSGLAWWRWNVVPARHDDVVGRVRRAGGICVPAAAGRAEGEAASGGGGG